MHHDSGNQTNIRTCRHTLSVKFRSPHCSRTWCQKRKLSKKMVSQTALLSASSNLCWLLGSGLNRTSKETSELNSSIKKQKTPWMFSINLLVRQYALTRILLAVSRRIMSALRVASCALWLMSRLREYEERLDERNGWGGGVVTKYVWITVVCAQHHTGTTGQKGGYYVNGTYSQTNHNARVWVSF